MHPRAIKFRVIHSLQIHKILLFRNNCYILLYFTRLLLFIIYCLLFIIYNYVSLKNTSV